MDSMLNVTDPGGSGFGSQQKQFALSIEYTKNTDRFRKE